MIRPPSSPNFAVIGNPIAHSRSPFIHEAFGRQFGLTLRYERIQSEADDFAETVRKFFADGGSGLNITVPFKEAAWELAQEHLSERARAAAAVNTLWQENDVLHGCNTDGVGLLADIERLGFAAAGRNILLVGAGGASKGVALPLLQAPCARLHIVNQTASKAFDLADHIRHVLPTAADRVSAGGLGEAEAHWDIVINATSSSLSGTPPDLPGSLYAEGALAYDMMYGPEPTPFMRQAQQDGATSVSDGLGMLVGQAAASFEIWHKLAPSIEPVLAQLRQQIRRPSQA